MVPMSLPNKLKHWTKSYPQPGFSKAVDKLELQQEKLREKLIRSI